MDRDFRLDEGSVRAALLGAVLAFALGCGPAAAAESADDLEHLRPLINQTLETEKSGVEIGWSNPATGHSGTLRVERTFYRGQQPCRAYLRTVERAGAAALVTRGVGCRTGRTQWELDEENATTRAPSARQKVASAEPAAKRREAPAALADAAADAQACPDPAAPAAARTGQPTPAPFAAFTLPARSAI